MQFTPYHALSVCPTGQREGSNSLYPLVSPLPALAFSPSSMAALLLLLLLLLLVLLLLPSPFANQPNPFTCREINVERSPPRVALSHRRVYINVAKYLIYWLRPGKGTSQNRVRCGEARSYITPDVLEYVPQVHNNSTLVPGGRHSAALHIFHTNLSLWDWSVHFLFVWTCRINLHRGKKLHLLQRAELFILFLAEFRIMHFLGCFS